MNLDYAIIFSISSGRAIILEYSVSQLFFGYPSFFYLQTCLIYVIKSRSLIDYLSVVSIYLLVCLFFIYLSILGVLIAAWWWTTCRSTGSTVTTRTTRLSSTTASWRLSGIRRTQEPGGKTYFRSPGKPLDEKKNVRRITGVFPTDINRTDYGFCLEISIEYKCTMKDVLRPVNKQQCVQRLEFKTESKKDQKSDQEND